MTRQRRTFDGTTGRPLATHASDYTDNEVEPANLGELAQVAASGTDASITAASAVQRASAPQTVVAVYSGPFGIPWWLWALLGIGAGYWLARQFGTSLSHSLARASTLTRSR